MSPRRPEGPPAVVLVDKPAGPTSFAVVRTVRRALGYRRVGHGGTLDPFATGLLVLALGPATRLLGWMQSGDKRYRATVRFGQATDSGDPTGTVLAEGPVAFDEAALREALPRFTGTIEQVPPALSAIKVDGERSYARVHRGEAAPPPPARQVQVHSLELLSFDGERAELDVRCGGGTYIRSLARDLGEALGTPAHCSALRRTAVAHFRVEDATPLDELAAVDRDEAPVLSPLAIAGELLRIPLDEDEAWSVRHGLQPQPEWLDREGIDEPPARAALVDPRGELVAACEADGHGGLKLAVVMPAPGAD